MEDFHCASDCAVDAAAAVDEEAMVFVVLLMWSAVPKAERMLNSKRGKRCRS